MYEDILYILYIFISNPGTEDCDNTKHYVYHRINS